MTYYPVAVNLTYRRAVVIGGGKVAERKIEALLDAKAKIKVVSPALTARLKRLSVQDRLVWVPRKVREADMRGVDIIISATNDAGVNKRISRWAGTRKILVNVVDNPRLSSFISTAFFRAHGAIISVYTDGKNPKLSRDLKNYLKEKWDDFLSYRRKL